MKEIIDIFKLAYEQMKTNLSLSLGIGFLMVLLNFLLNFKIPFLGSVIYGPILMGNFRVLHHFSVYKKFQLKELIWFFLDLERFGKSLIIGIAYYLMTFIGLIFLIIPGVWLGVRYFLIFPLVAIEDHLSLEEAFNRTSKIVDYLGWWKVFKFLLSCWFVSILGLLFFGVGVLFTLPLCYLAIIYLIVDYKNSNGDQKTRETSIIPMNV